MYLVIIETDAADNLDECSSMLAFCLNLSQTNQTRYSDHQHTHKSSDSHRLTQSDPAGYHIRPPVNNTGTNGNVVKFIHPRVIHKMSGIVHIERIM